MTRKRTHKGRTRRSQGRRPAKQKELLTGVIRLGHGSNATVSTPEGSFRVSPRGIREAMDGDTVQVSLATAKGGEKLAYVQMVIERAASSFIGRFEVAGPLGVVVPLDSRMRHDFFMPPEDRSAEKHGVGVGDIVSARIVEYPTRSSAAMVTIERRIGAADDLDMAIEQVIASFGLATQFSAAALAEAEALAEDADGALAADPARRDLRGLFCITVDPADARDFDDAVGATRLPDGGFELWVHIADVTHYVVWDGSIDNEAKQRCCSVYLADRVIPMLPERLSNELCSLMPERDRLSMSVRMRLDKRGRTVEAEACTGVIRSAKRLAYDEVDAILAGEAAAEPELAELLSTLDEIRVLRERMRAQRGSIDFDTVEARVVLDEKGAPTGVSLRCKTPATSLIEEAMLAANESVAKMLADAELRSAFRVHEQPSPDHLKACIAPLREMDVLAPDDTAALVAGEPQAIRRVLAAAEGTSAEYLANALLLRAQKRAVYLPDNEGHYALAAPAYCHFTSPIRRYPDMIVHRSLKALLAGSTESREQRAILKRLPQLCAACSEQERTADGAARASQKVKMAELFSEKIGESFAGIVSGVERYGLFVILEDSYAEGLLPVRELGSEWFTFDENRMTLTGEESGRVWRLGQRVPVRVEGADPQRGQIDFALADGGRAHGGSAR